MANEQLKVLLVSKKNQESTTLLENLSRNPGYSVTHVETAEIAMQHILKGDLNCVVFNFDSFGHPQAKLVEGIRQVTQIFQILIFADKVDADSMKKVKDMKSLVIIERPLLNLQRDVTGLCERLIGGEAVYQRESKRLPTYQKAKIEFHDSHHAFVAYVTDLSNKGACIQTSETSLTSGTILKLTIELDKLGKTRVVQCEVRWSQITPGKCIAGLQFK